MRTWTLSLVLGLAAVAWAGEEPGHAVTSSIDIEFHGRLKADASYDDSRVTTGNYVLWVQQEHQGPGTTNDNEFNMTANETRLWFDFKGPTVDGLATGGKVEFDFYGGTTDAEESRSKLMLRRAYIEAGWEEYGLSFLAGQHSDIMSPLVASTLNYTVAWDLGNIGYRRPQMRVTQRIDLGGDTAMDVQGAIARTVSSETLTGVLRTDYGEDSGLPTFEGRIGLSSPPIVGTRPLSFGVSGHWGEEEVRTSTFERDIPTYSFNVDAKIPILLGTGSGSVRPDFEISGEFFWGANLDAYFGGIGQGVNVDQREEVEAKGGWGQLAFVGVRDWRFVIGGGIDDPSDGDVPTGGRLQNRFLFGNATYSVTKNLQLGIEYGYYTTLYRGPDGSDNRVQFSVMYNF